MDYLHRTALALQTSKLNNFAVGGFPPIWTNLRFALLLIVIIRLRVLYLIQIINI